MYLVVLKRKASIPACLRSAAFTQLDGQRVLYCGIAGTSGSRRQSLRKRFIDHFHKESAGRSTLRKSLGVLFGYKQVPRDTNPASRKTKFSATKEQELSGWMTTSLLFLFAENAAPDEFEGGLVSSFNPPLNLKGNSSPVNADFRRKLSDLRRGKK